MVQKWAYLTDENHTKLAQRLGVKPNSVSKWVRGRCLPKLAGVAIEHMIEKLNGKGKLESIPVQPAKPAPVVATSAAQAEIPFPPPTPVKVFDAPPQGIRTVLFIGSPKRLAILELMAEELNIKTHPIQ